jgi:hypothetical protein
MAKLTIHGGDFKKGDGWFYSGSRFVLHDVHGRPQSIPLVQIEAAERASESSLRIFGCDESLLSNFEQAKAERKAGEQMFIACFDDGRLLLASTDQQSVEEVCAAQPEPTL